MYARFRHGKKDEFVAYRSNHIELIGNASRAAFCFLDGHAGLMSVTEAYCRAADSSWNGNYWKHFTPRQDYL